MIELNGAEVLLITIAMFAGLIKLCMVFNESRVRRYEFCHGVIIIERDVMEFHEQQENHDALGEVSNS